MTTDTALSPKDRLIAAIAAAYPGYEYQDIESIVTNERPADAIVWLPFAITPIGNDPWDNNIDQLKPAGILEARLDTTDQQINLNIEGLLESLRPDFAECYKR